MKKDGTIKLKGVNITIDGSDKITQKAGQKIDANALTIKLSGTKIDIKGTKTTVQGTLLDLSAAAVAKLKGAITKIG